MRHTQHPEALEERGGPPGAGLRGRRPGVFRAETVALVAASQFFRKQDALSLSPGRVCGQALKCYYLIIRIAAVASVKKNNDSPVKTLKISISGVRGVVGDTLTPELLARFAQGFGTYLGGGRVVIGRDTRTSGPMVRYAVVAGLSAAGTEVLDLGVVPVPTVQVMVRKLKADGGIAITASHNPAEWNALKFIRGDGCFLNQYQANELLGIFHQGDMRYAPAGEIPEPREIKGAVEAHAEAVFEKLGKLKGRRPKVVVDCVNGAGSVMSPWFLRELGCETVELHTKPDGIFPRPPEPLPKNLQALCETVKREKADVGFAQDADADRLAIVDERGVPIGEEYTLALAVDYILRREKGAVVVNLSTTSAIDDIAAAHGRTAIRTKIGEINVVERMKSENAVIGGEGNGGVIYPAVNYGRDSFVGMAIALHYLVESGKKMSKLAASLPQYKMVKTSVQCPTVKAFELIEKLRVTHADENPDCTDGLKIHRGGGWVLVRPSNTEPIVRLISEARTQGAAEKLQSGLAREIAAFVD